MIRTFCQVPPCGPLFLSSLYAMCTAYPPQVCHMLIWLNKNKAWSQFVELHLKVRGHGKKAAIFVPVGYCGAVMWWGSANRWLCQIVRGKSILSSPLNRRATGDVSPERREQRRRSSEQREEMVGSHMQPETGSFLWQRWTGNCAHTRPNRGRRTRKWDCRVWRSEAWLPGPDMFSPSVRMASAERSSPRVSVIIWSLRSVRWPGSCVWDWEYGQPLSITPEAQKDATTVSSFVSHFQWRGMKRVSLLSLHSGWLSREALVGWTGVVVPHE